MWLQDVPAQAVLDHCVHAKVYLLVADDFVNHLLGKPDMIFMNKRHSPATLSTSAAGSKWCTNGRF